MRVEFGCPPARPCHTLPLVASILPNLSRIESIALNARSSSPWFTFPPKFCTAFQNSLRLTSIKAVDIGSHGFPLSTLEDCTNLRDLQLCGSFTGQGVSTSPYPRLHTLRVDSRNVTRIVLWMKNRGPLHTLSLRLIYCTDFLHFRPLIVACSLTLVVLELNIGLCEFMDFCHQRRSLTKLSFQSQTLPRQKLFRISMSRS
jgi:hypothetical protein